MSPWPSHMLNDVSTSWTRPLACRTLAEQPISCPALTPRHSDVAPCAVMHHHSATHPATVRAPSIRRARSPGHVGWTSQPQSTTLGHIPASQHASTRPRMCQILTQRTQAVRNHQHATWPRFSTCRASPRLPHATGMHDGMTRPSGMPPEPPDAGQATRKPPEAVAYPQLPSTPLWRVPAPTVCASHAKRHAPPLGTSPAMSHASPASPRLPGP